MAENSLVTQPRTAFGKGASRRIRRDGRIPAVLYGHGSDPVHISVPAHETFMILRSSANALFTLELEAGNELALAKDVQRNPVRGVIEHVDFIIVRRGEKVEVEVPVEVVGESAPGTIHTVELQTLRVEAEATNVPASFEVNIEGLEAGSIIHAGAITLPAGTTLVDDPELQVVNVLIPRVEVEEPVEAAEGEEAEAAPAAEAASEESAPSED